MSLLVAILLSAAAQTGAHPRLDTIVFSGQLHRLRRHPGDGYEKAFKISDPVDAAHLYTIDRGGHRRQLTFGKFDDLVPRYSPSLGGLLFVRPAGRRRNNQLMFLRFGVRNPVAMGRLPHGDVGNSAVSESGQTYVVSTGIFSEDGGDRLAVAYRGRVVKILPYADFQIVPGTERLFVQADGQPFFFDAPTGKLTKIGWSERTVAWLNSRKALAASLRSLSTKNIQVRNVRGDLLGTIPGSLEENVNLDSLCSN